MPKFFLYLLLSCTGLIYAQNADNNASSIVAQAIQNSSLNDPRAVLNNFTYTSYEKTVITDSLSGGTHNFFSEKVSSMQYTNGNRFAEEIIGYQLAGFKKPRYEIFAVNVQSRSFYDKHFVIFNTRYAGILSKRGLDNYHYKTLDGPANGDFKIAFTPKKPKRVPGLTGIMILDKKSLAIKGVELLINDGVNIKLTQEYKYHEYVKLYLPASRKLLIDKGNGDKRLSFFGGRISIGSIETEVLEDIVNRKFLIATTKMTNYRVNQIINIPSYNYAITFKPDASTKDEPFWQNYRTDGLSNKDVRSFSELEKIVDAENIERRLGTINNFSVGYFSVKAFDFDLTYPVKFNNYEGLRLGLGGVTNAAFSDRFRIEGYGAYGFKDKNFKYGIGGGYLLLPDKGMWLSATFNSDIEEVGNFAYLTDRRVYSLFEPRLVNITQFYKHRTSRINLEYRLTPRVLTELQLANRRMDQINSYRYSHKGTIIRNYDITEATAAFRWSPANKYLKTEGDVVPVYEGYPIFSGQLSHAVNALGGDLSFTRLGAKGMYRFERLNKSATEFLIEGNIGFGDIPLTHLFHAYPNAPTKETILQRFSVAGVNSFETMYFGEFFSDQLFTAQVRHSLRPFHITDNFKPELVFISRFAIGDIRHPENHLDTSFKSLEHGYTESGFEINKLLFGFGTSLTYRYGAYHLPDWEDNLAFKFTFNLKL